MLTIELPSFYMEFQFSEARKIPKSGGIYYFYNESMEVVYVGKTNTLRSRIRAHLSGTSNTYHCHDDFSFVRIYPVDDPAERDIYETYAINTLKPKYNISKTFYKQRIEPVEIEIEEEVQEIEEKIEIEAEWLNYFGELKGRRTLEKARRDYPKQWSQYMRYKMKAL